MRHAPADLTNHGLLQVVLVASTVRSYLRLGDSRLILLHLRHFWFRHFLRRNEIRVRMERLLSRKVCTRSSASTSKRHSAPDDKVSLDYQLAGNAGGELT